MSKPFMISALHSGPKAYPSRNPEYPCRWPSLQCSGATGKHLSKSPIHRLRPFLTPMSVSHLPQELIECIFSFSSLDDIRQCSRVCSGWTDAAQRLLFHDISFSPMCHKNAGFTHNELVSRFGRTLLSAPHLASHVRVHKLDPTQVVPSQAQHIFEALSHLKEVRVTDFEDAPVSVFTGPERGQSHMPLNDLLKAPSIQTLTIGCGAWYLGDVLPCLRSCGPGLRELDIEDVVFEGYGYGLEAAATMPNDIKLRQLQRLSIRRGFVGLLADLNRMPGVELSVLKELEILLGVRNAQMLMKWRTDPTSAINEVLRRNNGCLEKLSLDVFLSEPLHKLCDISQLRSLTLHIRWHVAGDRPLLWLHWLVASLEYAELDELNLRVTTYADDLLCSFGLQEQWGRLDKVLARSTLRRLIVSQDVDVAVCAKEVVSEALFPSLLRCGVQVSVQM
ncbi:hypothetical protein CYLTODRAFT_495113 [Cylindrobasidium torrendii FP15055 ss-10]|uniref:F-box domain-containing protein n=1 Tax=Cylindrobasidium torrendii FP15055 ss-10 TaxID=1314674 RepID=A0A0D7AUN6_9AGAR|nr:hypothetical protein CYLTODRAFT_495113 [Cylindrobasidium torrendii FP15055 ss-10]